MFKELVKVFGETIVYGFTGVASTLASAFLVPFYTRVLTPADYGVSALIGTLFSILVVVANLGMSSAIFQAYFRAKQRERRDVVGTSFISQTIFPLSLSLVVFSLAGFISQILFGDNSAAYFVRLSSLALFFNAGIMVPLALLRAEGHPVNYVSINLVKLFSTILLSILLVVVLRLGLNGVFWANLAGAFFGYLMGLAYTLKRIKLVFSKYWIGVMLRFGGPLVPAGLALWVLNSSDRYFLNAFVGISDVGIYNVGYKVGALVTLVGSSLQLAYPRFLFAIYNDKPNPKDYFKKINTYFYLLTFTAAFVVSVFAKEGVQILTGPAFHDAYKVVPLIAFSYVAYSLYQNFGTGVFLAKKTYLSAVSTAIASGLNLILHYLLISRFGIMGAALSTFLSFLFLALIQLRFSQGVYRFQFEFRRLLKVFVVGGTLVYMSTLMNFGLAASLLAKFLLVVAFPVLLYLLKFFEERELKKLSVIWSVLKSSRGRPGVFVDSLKQELIT